ncbi:MAG TPA: hypothetical protein VFE42_30130 [Chloroflexota bacterium]|nr:hypothetical protein [Chloroflexota bacterium]
MTRHILGSIVGVTAVRAATPMGAAHARPTTAHIVSKRPASRSGPRRLHILRKSDGGTSTGGTTPGAD